MNGSTTGVHITVVFHFLLGVFSYMGREWELSYRLGMRPLIFVVFCSGRRSVGGISRLPVWSGFFL